MGIGPHTSSVEGEVIELQNLWSWQLCVNYSCNFTIEELSFAFSMLKIYLI